MSVSAKVLQFAKNNVGKRVFFRKDSAGVCWDLAERALELAGGKTSTDIMGDVSGDVDYVWGTKIALDKVKPGDIVQFRGHRFDLQEEDNNGISTSFAERPHHTAIVEEVKENGELVLLEQNLGGVKTVHRNTAYFSNATFTKDSVKITVAVKGNAWFYRPLPK